MFLRFPIAFFTYYSCIFMLFLSVSSQVINWFISALERGDDSINLNGGKVSLESFNNLSLLSPKLQAARVLVVFLWILSN